MLRLARAAFAVVLAWAATANADVYTGRWLTLESEHFTLYYHVGLEPIAPDVIAMCEQAHALLTPSLAQAPPDRTHVVLVDTVDAANGSAGVVPRNAMQLLAMAPESDSVLGFYENWMWNLVVHEYTHIVHIDSMGAGFRALNRPFGKRFAPNQLLPRWFVEGLATWQESVHSSRGRVNSARFRGILDAAALHSAIPDIGVLSGVPVEWPGATGWYLYGSFFIDWIARTHGDASLAAFVEQYGGRALPLGVNVVARDNFGASFEELWDQWRDAARAEALERLERRGELTEWEAVTTRGYDSDRVVGDGRRVAWLVDDGRTRRRIEERGPDGARSVAIEESASFALLGDDSLVVSQSRSTGRSGAFRDLHVIDGRGRFDRLTRRARAREPAASPDGSLIVYVRPEAGRTDLVAFDVRSGEHSVLVEAVAWGQVATPRFSPDGSTVVFSYLVPGEGRDLYTVDVRSGALAQLTETDATALDPTYSPDGRCVLYSADYDGSFDIYAHNPETGEDRRLSRSATGAYHPAPWVDGETRWLYASVVSARGYDIVRRRVDSFCDAEPSLAVHVAGEAVLPEEAAPVEGRRFREGRAFIPLRWTPTLAAAGSDVAFGASFGGGDPIGLWAWDATALWTTQLDTWAAAMGLGTRRLPVDLNVYAASQAAARSQSMIAQSRYVPYIERNTLITPSFSVPFNGRQVSRSITAAYTFQLVGYEQTPVFRHQPWDIEPVMPLIGRLDGWSLSLGMSDTTRYADSISTEAGWALSTGIRLRRRALGSLNDATEVTAGGRGYIPLWGRWVLAGRVSGGWNAVGRGSGRYGVGGPSAQDVLVALRFNAPAGTANVRGFSPQLQAGRLYGLGSGEVRFPLLDFDWGAGTFPLQLSRLSGAAFVDVGSAFDDLDGIEPLVGVGAEVRVDATLGYFRGAAFRAGFARGVVGEGIWDVYAVYGWGF